MMAKLVIIEYDMHDISLIPGFLSPCVVQTSPALLCFLLLNFLFLSSHEKHKVKKVMFLFFLPLI